MATTSGSGSQGARAPYMVLAHHRSGSNFLNDVLQAHPQVECLNEPLSMHTPYFRQCDLMPWSSAEFDPRWLHPALTPHDALRGFLHEFRDYLYRSCSARVIGFKETVLFGKLEWLKEFLPPLRIVFLKRDPRAIISSVLRSELTGFWNYAELVPPAFRRLWPLYERSSTGDPATAAAEIAAMSVATRYALAHRSLQSFEHRVVGLEDLMQAPAPHLQAIAQFLGVQVHDEQLQFLSDRQSTSRGGAFSSFRCGDDVRDTWRRHLSTQQIDVIERVLRASGGAA